MKYIKKALPAGAAVAALALTGLAISTPASAAENRAAGRATLKSGCHYQLVATENVKIRRAPTTKSDALGLFLHDTTATCVEEPILGDPYTACGRSSNFWSHVNYRGMDGYIAYWCARSAQHV